MYIRDILSRKSPIWEFPDTKPNQPTRDAKASGTVEGATEEDCK